MVHRRIPEPCLCGDPYCRRCFPGGYYEQDENEAYDEQRQSEIDSKTEESQNGSKE